MKRKAREKRPSTRYARRRLLTTIIVYTRARSWPQARRMLRRRPALLSPACDTLLGRFAEVATAESDGLAALLYEQHRSLLLRWRDAATSGVTGHQPTEDPEVQEAAAQLWELSRSEPGGGEWPATAFLWNFDAVGVAFLHEYERTGQAEDLELAIVACETALAQIPTDLVGRVIGRNNLAAGLQARYARTSDPRTLEQSVMVCEEALAEAPVGLPGRAACLRTLGDGLLERHGRTGDLEDLERSVAACEEALAETTPDSPARASCLVNLGEALWARYTATRSLDDLEQATSVFQEAAIASDDSSIELVPLGIAWHENYTRLGDPDDLERAINAFEQAASSSPPGSPYRPAILNDLGVGLRDRYQRTGDHSDLERAISVYDEALSGIPSGAFSRLSLLSNLGNSLTARYQASGDLNDLERAIAVHQEAVAATSPGAVDRSGYLTALGAGLHSRYERTGDMNDLDDAITAFDRASDAAPVSSHNRPVCLMNLGNGLYVRYGRHGDLDDLDWAVACYEEAVRETPVGSPDRPPRLVSLGNGLRNRYLRSHRLGDLNRAVACYEEAVGAAPVGSPDRPGHLNSLGNGLLSRYQYTGELDDLERAVAACAEALNLTSADAPERLAYLNGLGNSLQDRYERLRRAEDLERAIEICEEAVGRAPSGSPHLPALLVNLGNVRQERYDRDGDADDLRRAVDSFRAACRKGLDASVEEGLRAAHNWGRWAAARASWSEAAEAYRYGLRAVRHLFRTQLGRRHKETWLWAAQAMPADAAYAFAMSGAPQDAAMALEGARVLLIAEALERNQADLARLRDTGHHDLYERYLTVADRSSFLERAEPQDDSRAWERARSAELKAARAELDEVIDEIRQVQGFGRFLDSPTFQDLAAAASPELPLAYLASAKPGGLLIVVDGRNVTTCLLPGLTEEVFHEKVVQYFSKYDPEAPGRAVAAWSDAIYELGRWLWDVTIGPLLTQLRSASAVVLIPVGPLALLPLHAAWTEDLDCPTGKRYALDDVLITYAPSARALTGARHRAAQTQPDFLLAVEEPWPVRGSSLPGASSEAQAAISAFGSRTCHLRHEDATRDAVLAGLREATVVHLVCHGYADLDRPLQSGMVLADDILLTVEQLFGLRFESRLAVLSACDAGLPGTELPDEVVNLPTGLLQAGVAGVVAPLWAVPDERTMLLMVGFYQRWRQEGQEPAEALRQAQRWLRDSTNGELRSMFQALYDQGPAAWLAQATTQACYEAVLLKDPDERSFADPVGWAAFTYIGT